MYLNKKNNPANQGSEGTDMLAWLKLQLSTNPQRKFIISSHIYGGAKYDQKAKNTFTPEDNAAYFQIISDYRDHIVLESFAHDHYADIRYHSSGNTSDTKYFFHNILIAPGVTPIDGSNPGVATYLVSKDTFVPSNLELHFIPLQ